jgi:Uma2 family endonuclease
MPVAAKIYTWDDIKDWPEGSDRTEIVHGELVVSPLPGNRHQRICTRLGSLLYTFVTERGLGEFFSNPVNVTLSPTDHFEPDLCFVRKERLRIIEEVILNGPPDLIIEVISESNRTHDTVVKFEAYARFGVIEYWLVDQREDTISTWRLADGRYELLARSRDTDSVVPDVLQGLTLHSSQIFPETG